MRSENVENLFNMAQASHAIRDASMNVNMAFGANAHTIAGGAAFKQDIHKWLKAIVCQTAEAIWPILLTHQQAGASS